MQSRKPLDLLVAATTMAAASDPFTRMHIGRTLDRLTGGPNRAPVDNIPDHAVVKQRLAAAQAKRDRKAAKLMEQEERRKAKHGKAEPT